jgi:hypothetical protein
VADDDDSVALFELNADSVIIDTLVVLPAVDTTYKFTMVADNKRHYFAAKGYLLDENVWSGFSNIVDTLLVKPPVLWFSDNKYFEVIVDWYDSTEDDLAGYEISYGFLPGEYQYKLYTTDSEYTLNVSRDKIYYFAIKAYDTSGNYSDYSKEVNTDALRYS